MSEQHGAERCAFSLSFLVPHFLALTKVHHSAAIQKLALYRLNWQWLDCEELANLNFSPRIEAGLKLNFGALIQMTQQSLESHAKRWWNEGIRSRMRAIIHNDLSIARGGQQNPPLVLKGRKAQKVSRAMILLWNKQWHPHRCRCEINLLVPWIKLIKVVGWMKERWNLNFWYL